MARAAIAAFNLGTKMTRFDYITKTANDCKPSWPNKDKIRFHYFNPHGIMAKRRASDDRIVAMVDSGFAKTGALLAYGSLNHYHTDKLMDLVNKPRVTDFEARYYVQQIEREILAADAFIESIAACI